MATLGNLELNILLKTDQLSAQAKNAIRIIEQVYKAGNGVGLFQNVDFSKFVNEINNIASESAKVNTSLSGTAQKETELKTATDGAAASTEKFNSAQKDVPVTLGAGNSATERMANSLMRMGLMMEGIRGIKETFQSLKSEFIDIGLQSEVTKKYFKGTEEQLESFKIATGRVADDDALIKLSNKATNLGVDLEKQTIMFALVKRAAEEMGGDLEGGFEKLVYVSEGAEKGLKSLGIQRKVYHEIIQQMVMAYAEENKMLDKNKQFTDENGTVRKLTIDMLPIEEQKRIRLDAVLKASNITFQDATNRQQTSYDKLKMFSAATEEGKEKIGSFVGNGLVRLLDELKITNPKVAETSGLFVSMGKSLIDMLPMIASLKIAFPGLFQSIITGAGGAAGAIGGIGAAVIIAIGTIKLMELAIEEFRKNTKTGQDLDKQENLRNKKSGYQINKQGAEEYYKKLYGDNFKIEDRKEGKLGKTKRFYLVNGQLWDEEELVIDYRFQTNKEFQLKKGAYQNLDKITDEMKNITTPGGGTGSAPSEKEDTSFQDTINALNTEMNLLKITTGFSEQDAENQITKLRALDSENLALDKKLTLYSAIKERVIEIIDMQKESDASSDGDIAARVKARIDAMRTAYEEKAGKLTKEGLKDERDKGFDEAGALKKAYQIERGLVDEKVSVEDLQAIIKFLDEGIIRLSSLKGQDDAIRQYTKDRTEAEKQINKILEDREKISDKNKELAIQTNKVLSPEEKEVASIKLKYDIELAAIDKKIEAIKNLDKVQSKLLATQHKLTVEEQKQAVQDKIKAVNLGKLESLQSSVTEATQAFFGALYTEGGTAGTALKALLKNLLNQLLTYVETKIVLAKVSASADAILTGGLSLLKDAPLLALAIASLEGARAYVNSFHTGGAIPGTGEQLILAKGGEHVINESTVNKLGHNFFDYLNSGGLPGRYGKYMNSNVNPAVNASIKEIPYIAETRVKGNDLAVLLRRADMKKFRKRIS